MASNRKDRKAVARALVKRDQVAINSREEIYNGIEIHAKEVGADQNGRPHTKIQLDLRELEKIRPGASDKLKNMSSKEITQFLLDNGLISEEAKAHVNVENLYDWPRCGASLLGVPVVARPQLLCAGSLVLAVMRRAHSRKLNMYRAAPGSLWTWAAP